MHETQKRLLQRLMIDPTLSYSHVTKGYSADDNIVFHLNMLVEAGFVAKGEEGYSITIDGVQRTTYFDLETLEEFHQKQLVLCVVCKTVDEKFLLKTHEQAKLPFYNLPSIVPHFGETNEQAIARLVKEISGATVSIDMIVFDSVHAKKILNSKRQVIFDDVCVVFEVKTPVIAFTPTNISCLTIEEIKALDNCWDEIPQCVLRNGWSVYKEYEIESEYIL